MLVYTKSAFVAITKAILAEATARPEDGLRASFMTRECASAGGCTYSYGSTTSGVGNGRLKHNFANTHIYSGSINATTPACDEAGAQSSNLCCCLPASNADGGRRLCPQQEADCAGTDWAFDNATNRCLAIQEGCPAGTHGTLSQTSSADACVPCAAGKYGTVAGVADESGACSACEPGLYASTAERLGRCAPLRHELRCGVRRKRAQRRNVRCGELPHRKWRRAQHGVERGGDNARVGSRRHRRVAALRVYHGAESRARPAWTARDWEHRRV